MRRPSGTAVDLSGRWTVAVDGRLRRDPRAARELGRDPLEPQPPPAAGVLSGGLWHTEERRVPGCWEDWGWSKRLEGPVWFITTFRWEGPGRTVVFRFEGVSYSCHVWLNGRHVGSHRGTWDAFEIVGETEETNTLAVEVIKPWERFFPVKSTLSGFVPYVTSTFGGIWKGVSVRPAEPVRLTGVYAHGIPGEGWLDVEIGLESLRPADATIRLELPAHGWTAEIETEAGSGPCTVTGRFSVPDLEPWTPASPALHELRATVTAAGRVDRGSVDIGIRRLAARGRGLELNGIPAYLRGVLHWMSYTDVIAPVFREDRHRAEMEYLEAAGFNLVKQCLVVPPEEYLELTDRSGMMLWIELPMWMPAVDDEFRIQAAKEYAAIVRQIRGHPSIVIWTLGCELDAAADGPFLTGLLEEVKRIVPDSPLLRDNSGSAEAYGGVELDISDFYDYHFYAEADRFSSLIDHFVPGWRPAKPLLFGEYCDSDTLRNVRAHATGDGSLPWWTSRDPDVNPKGVRWDMNILDHPGRAVSLELPFSWDRCIELSRTKSLEYRQIIIERTRLDPRTSGYVVTNIADTPISTAGLFDVDGEPKFRTEDLRRFNGDIVLCLERERRRIWARGGDRIRRLDPYSLTQGEHARYRVIASYFHDRRIDGRLRITLTDGEGRTAAESVSRFEACPGFTGEAGTIDFDVPVADRPRAFTLTAELSEPAGLSAENRWMLWTFPRPVTPLPAGTFIDPGGIPSPLPENLPPETLPDGGEVMLTSRLGPGIIDRYRRGGRIVVLLDRHLPPLTLPAPFWREGIPFLEESPVFADLPRGGIAGAHFLGITPDLALDNGAVSRLVGSEGSSLIRRIDARTLEETSYWMEWRSGSAGLIVTTLPLLGSGERSPAGLSDNVLGAHLLRSALTELLKQTDYGRCP